MTLQEKYDIALKALRNIRAGTTSPLLHMVETSNEANRMRAACVKDVRRISGKALKEIGE